MWLPDNEWDSLEAVSFAAFQENQKYIYVRDNKGEKKVKATAEHMGSILHTVWPIVTYSYSHIVAQQLSFKNSQRNSHIKNVRKLSKTPRELLTY